MEMNEEGKVYTRMAKLCAGREYSVQDMKSKLARTSFDRSAAEKILNRLIEERFVDDRRYAAAYIRDKIFISGWGCRKIKYALAAKGISAEIAEPLLREILGEVPGVSEVSLGRIIEKKYMSVQGRYDMLDASDRYKCRASIIRHCMSKGYEIHEIQRALDLFFLNLKQIE